METAPAPVLAQAQTAGLGTQVDGWHLTPVGRAWRSLILAAVLAAIAVGCFLWWRAQPPRSLGGGLQIVVIVVAAICAVQAVYALVRFLFRLGTAGRSLYLFENGLVEGRGSSGQVTDFRGADITDESVRIIRNGVDRGVETNFRIKGPQANWHLNAPPEFFSTVHAAVHSRAASVRLPELVNELQAGRTLDFRTASLSPTALTVPNGESVPHGTATGFSVASGIWTLAYGDVVQREVSGSVNDTVNYLPLRALLTQLNPGINHG